MLTFEVSCDNKASYNIVVKESHKLGRKAVILVKCDRIDPTDNERGFQLANQICAFLNSLPEKERRQYVSAEMLP